MVWTALHTSRSVSSMHLSSLKVWRLKHQLAALLLSSMYVFCAGQVTVSLRADPVARNLNAYFLFHAVLTGTSLENGNTERVESVFANDSVESQARRICDAWSLNHKSCVRIRELLEVAMSDAQWRDTRKTLTKPHDLQHGASTASDIEWEAGENEFLSSVKRPQLQAKLQEYVQLHAAALEGGPQKGFKFLICQPTRGLSNQIQAIMSCFTLALATNRCMLLDWEGTLRFNRKIKHLQDAGTNLAEESQVLQDEIAKQKQERRTGSDVAVGLNTLLTLPFFNWSVRDALTNHPILAGKHGNWTDSVEIAHLSQSTICQDPSKRLSNVSVIVLTESHWLPGLLQSDYAKFQKWFGIGPSLLGIGPSLFAIGPALFSPSKRLSPIIAEMESALRHEVQHTIGLQIGMQDADDIKLAGDFLRCSHAVLPSNVRSNTVRIGWFLATDNANMQDAVMNLLEQSEGSIQSVGLIGGALTAFNGTKVLFRSGSHLTFLASEHQHQNIDIGAKLTMFEMWSLMRVDTLVVTEDSPLGDVVRLHNPNPSFVTAHNGRCYPASTLLPLGAGVMYEHNSPCFLIT